MLRPDNLAPCHACGGSVWWLLPQLGPRSMRSDGELLHASLRRSTCSGCGTARLETAPDESAVRELFGERYALYAHAGGDRFEQERQQSYAAWIKALLPVSFAPSNLLEIGCGNGSLLTELAGLYPMSTRRGIEPVSAAADHARDAGHDVLSLFFDEESGAEISPRHDLVVSVNVLEHATEPRSFLKGLASAMAPEGYAVIICPDGERPSVELLMQDHIHSFTAAALHNLAQRAGLVGVNHAVAPGSIGAFQAIVLQRAASGNAVAVKADPRRAHEARCSFLEAWKDLDNQLAMLCGHGPIVCFGIGETAQLLRAYAPTVWEKIGRFVADGAAVGKLDGRTVTPYAPPARRSEERYLLAVRTELQERMAARLSSDGLAPIRWDHIAAI